jgi:DNA-binding NarL/FixJ family response regulator
VTTEQSTLRPVRVSIVNDYEVIVRGIAGMLGRYPEHIRVIETEAGGLPDRTTDVVLFDSFGGREHVFDRIRSMVAEPDIGAVVLYTWDANPQVLTTAHQLGVRGVIPKQLTASDLVASIQRVAAGEIVGMNRPFRRGFAGVTDESLTEREREVLALLSRGLTNRQIGDELYLGVETVRTHVRNVLRKLGVDNRTQAALYALTIGLGPRDVLQGTEPSAAQNRNGS